MRNLVPLTKILLTLGTAVWAIIFMRAFQPCASVCVGTDHSFGFQ